MSPVLQKVEGSVQVDVVVLHLDISMIVLDPDLIFQHMGVYVRP